MCHELFTLYDIWIIFGLPILINLAIWIIKEKAHTIDKRYVNKNSLSAIPSISVIGASLGVVLFSPIISIISPIIDISNVYRIITLVALILGTSLYFAHIISLEVRLFVLHFMAISIIILFYTFLWIIGIERNCFVYSFLP